MPRPQTKEPIPINVPTGGVDFSTPLSQMDPVFSPWMINFEVEERFVKARDGIKIHANFSHDGANVIMLLNYNNSKLFAYVKDTLGDGYWKIWDVTAEGTYTTPADHDLSDDFNEVVHPVKYAGIAGFMTNSALATASAVYNGTSWGAWGWTYDDGGGADPIGGVASLSYKGRFYIFGRTRTDLYYGGLTSITGAMTRVNLASLFEQNQYIRTAGILSNPGLRADEAFMVMVNIAGEVLIYAGDNPGEDNWELIGKHQIGVVLDARSYLQYNNDLLILTTQGVVSVNLLINATNPSADNITISKRINPYFTKLVKSVVENYGDTTGTFASMAYWPEKNKIYVLMRGFIDIDGTYEDEYATMFVFNCTTGSWSIFKITSIQTTEFGNLTYFQNNIYYHSGLAIMKFDEGVYKDERFDDPNVFDEYDLELHSAYINYGSNDKYKMITGIEPIINTDFDGGDVGIKAAADFGRSVSAAATPTLSEGYQIPHYNVGAQGCFLQYRIDGNSTAASTAGYELYSVGMIVK